MEFERRNYAELPQPSGAFHHSVRSGNTLYIAGSTAGGTSAAVLATSKSGTLLLRRDQGDMAVLLDSRRCRL